MRPGAGARARGGGRGGLRVSAGGAGIGHLLCCGRGGLRVSAGKKDTRLDRSGAEALPLVRDVPVDLGGGASEDQPNPTGRGLLGLDDSGEGDSEASQISHKNQNKTRAQEKVNRVFLKPRPGEDGPAAAAQSTGRKGTQAASAHHPRTKLQHGRRRRAPCTVDAHAGQACQVCRDRDVREALSVTCHAARRTPCGQRRARSSNRGLVGRGVAGTAQSAGLTRARLRCVLFRLLWLFVIP